MRFITLAIIFLAGCSDIPVESTSSSKLTPEVAIAKGDTFSTVGTSCAPGCIWSGYAVAMEAQEATEDCSGIPCVCVEEGNIWSLCETEQE